MIGDTAVNPDWHEGWPASIVMEYLSRLRMLHSLRGRLTEQTAQHALVILIEGILKRIRGSSFFAVPECAHKGIGRPDLTFMDTSAIKYAFLEMKMPGKSLSRQGLRGSIESQFEKYATSSCWVYTNFLEFHLYEYDYLITKIELFDYNKLFKKNNEEIDIVNLRSNATLLGPVSA